MDLWLLQCNEVNKLKSCTNNIFLLYQARTIYDCIITKKRLLVPSYHFSGAWVVFDKANMCSSSVLDRLNPLFEPGMSAQVVWDISVSVIALWPPIYSTTVCSSI